jgi:membrane fusion protein, macrolide-specific efflux system
MKNKKKKFCFTLTAVIFASLLLISVMHRTATSEEETKVISPFMGSIRNIISTTGTVQPQNRLEIKPPLSGRIESVLVNEGDKVKVGQTLAMMSSIERAALLDSARAQGEEALKYWQEAYKPIPLIAPIDGEIIVRAVEPGQTITSSDAVLVISDRLIVRAQVDETDVGKVQLGQKASISLDAYPNTKIKAVVQHIYYESKIVNNVTMYEVDMIPDEVPAFFRSGMNANIDIMEKDKENILLIPIDAVSSEKDGKYVFISQGAGKESKLHKVETGISDDKNIEIISGLSTKDKVLMTVQKYVPPKSKSASGSNPFTPFGQRGAH